MADLFASVVVKENHMWRSTAFKVIAALFLTLAGTMTYVGDLVANNELPMIKPLNGGFIVTQVVLPQPPPVMIRQKTKLAERPSIPFDAPEGFKPEPPELPSDPVPEGDPKGEYVPPEGKIFTEPPPPPPPPPPSVKEKEHRIGGDIKPPTKIADAVPVYPTMAMAARIEGVVIIEASIDATGQVRDARVLRSIPLLDQAALDAVRQWRYTPTLLNGVPVPVVMTVTVRFSLNRD